ncbi:MAG: MurR/RpiR family transcriptional regulator [Lachnospiraceae bacterium]|nr:MurR/RpiR family transcriptional regulator [Lachnospiraceae bacterium]
MGIDERICHADLTKSERNVLNHIINNKEEACYYTILEVANAVKVSRTTVMRATAKLGYENFNQFKKDIQAEVLDQAKRVIDDRPYIELLKGTRDYDVYEILESCSANQVKELRDSFSRNGYEKYIQISEAIMKAERVYLVGFHMAGGVIDYFSRLLKYCRGNVITLTDGSMNSRELADLTERDCAVVVSFPRRSEYTYMALDLIKKSGCKLVVMTDKITESICKGATHVLLTFSNGVSFFNSYLGIMANIELVMSVISGSSVEIAEKRLADTLQNGDLRLVEIC